MLPCAGPRSALRCALPCNALASVFALACAAAVSANDTVLGLGTATCCLGGHLLLAPQHSILHLHGCDCRQLLCSSTGNSSLHGCSAVLRVILGLWRRWHLRTTMHLGCIAQCHPRHHLAGRRGTDVAYNPDDFCVLQRSEALHLRRPETLGLDPHRSGACTVLRRVTAHHLQHSCSRLAISVHSLIDRQRLADKLGQHHSAVPHLVQPALQLLACCDDLWLKFPISQFLDYLRQPGVGALPEHRLVRLVETGGEHAAPPLGVPAGKVSTCCWVM